MNTPSAACVVVVVVAATASSHGRVREVYDVSQSEEASASSPRLNLASLDDAGLATTA